MARLEAASQQIQEETLAWLIAFRDVYVQDYIDVKKLVPPNVWEWYKNQQIKKGIYEVERRAEITKRLHAEWMKRPDCLRRSKVKDASKPRRQSNPA